MASANPDQDKFKEELNWCIEHLELKIPNVKSEKQVKEISKAISSLKNPKRAKSMLYNTKKNNSKYIYSNFFTNA